MLVKGTPGDAIMWYVIPNKYRYDYKTNYDMIKNINSEQRHTVLYVYDIV